MKRTGLLLLLLVITIPIPAQLNQSVIDINIGGLFPLTGALSLGGIDRNSAFHMAIDQINQDPTILNGYKLVGLTKDTATDPQTAVTAATDLVRSNVVALIGASSSSVSAAVSQEVGTVSKLPQISYSSTSAQLSDTQNYPYFVRVVPSDAFQNQALIEIVNAFNWDVVSILRSANLYGQGVGQVDSSTGDLTIGVGSLISAAKQYNIEVVEDHVINSSSEIQTYLQRIKYFGSNIILLNVYLADAIKIFETAATMGMTSQNGYVWIGSDAASQQEVLDANNATQQAMQGMLGLKPYQPEGIRYNEFINTWQNCAGKNASVYPGCGDRNPNFYAPFAYDATYFLAHTLDTMIKSGEDIYNGDLLLQQLLNTQYSGVTGDIRLNKQGDRISGYDVINVQQNQFVIVGNWDPITGFSQTRDIYWRGDPNQTINLPPQERLASSWMILLSVIIIPIIIFLVRKLLERLRRRSL